MKYFSNSVNIASIRKTFEQFKSYDIWNLVVIVSCNIKGSLNACTGGCCLVQHLECEKLISTLDCT